MTYRTWKNQDSEPGKQTLTDGYSLVKMVKSNTAPLRVYVYMLGRVVY
jgi:hypothetical protein